MSAATEAIEVRILRSRAARLTAMLAEDWEPGDYSPWRHGGWYVGGIVWPNGGCGCVSRNYADGKWRIACDPRPFDEAPTFRNRTEAAYGERDLCISLWLEAVG